MNILGISCHYHDSAACLVQDGKLVAASQEERFNRVKASPDFPVLALNDCLQQGGITIDDVQAVAFYEKPFLKLERVLMSHLRAWPGSLRTFMATLPPWLDDRLILPLTLRSELGYEGEIHFVPHHVSHAASAFLASSFQESAILTADGVGEWSTTTMGVGKGSKISLHKELRYPDSLGLIYTAITTWLGFKALRGEGKVMALAEFGEPRFLDQLYQIVDVKDDGSFRVDPEAFSIVEGDRMYGDRFVDMFGPAREFGSEIKQEHKDMATSLQRMLEEVLLKMAHGLHAETNQKNLVMAGGVCLNITATSRVLEETSFEQLFIQPAAGDSGGALGAALYLSQALGDPRGPAMTHAYLGPAYNQAHCKRLLRNRRIAFRELSDEDLVREVARMVADDKIVGWFQGRLEFGPRALGHRTILGNPCHPDMKDIMNARVKHREPFRPYGVSVMLDRVGEFFDYDQASPYMLQVAFVRPELKDRIPTALHINDTSRLQTVAPEEDQLYYDLISAFYDITGVPMVINTSFNDNNEPIVCTPEDALDCYVRTGLDGLALGNLLVVRDEGDA